MTYGRQAGSAQDPVANPLGIIIFFSGAGMNIQGKSLGVGSKIEGKCPACIRHIDMFFMENVLKSLPLKKNIM